MSQILETNERQNELMTFKRRRGASGGGRRQPSKRTTKGRDSPNLANLIQISEYFDCVTIVNLGKAVYHRSSRLNKICSKMVLKSVWGKVRSKSLIELPRPILALP